MLVRVVGALMSLAALVLVAPVAEAQDRIAPGYMDIAFSLGDGAPDDAGVAVGFRTERLFGTIGKGVWGLQASASAHTQKFGLANKWLFTPFGLAATYHFKPGSAKLDPFFVAGGGYKVTSCLVLAGTTADCTVNDNEFYPIARVGAKYFVSERVGFSLDGGLGASYVTFALNIKIH